MAYKITDECIACGTCASECPVEAITEGDGIFVIDADACIECASSSSTPTPASSAATAPMSALWEPPRQSKPF